MLQKVVRPRKIDSKTVKTTTGCGSLYITVGLGKDGNPIEVFSTLGKAGGCSNCQNEALTRAVSLGLKYGIPAKEFAEQLRYLQCPSMVKIEGNDVRSCADALAQVLLEHCNGSKESP